ncbi:hypothetical protein ACHAXA_011477 [Cyclostephanos tholiformis]|uniref:Aminoglycoside phosphotransferase domain-containing protein n=1 Tax=Cyclostephanos tholiformis TaxID=382380 RepID=A0ABD3SEF4_9STRA
MGHIYEITFAIAVDGGANSAGGGGMERRNRRFIVKYVNLPPQKNGRRGLGDERKAHSYVVESNFYRHLAPMLLSSSTNACGGLRMPVPYHVENGDGDDVRRVVICMSVLDGSPSNNCGLGGDADDVRSVLSWLATFHARTWHTRINHDELIEGRIIQPIGSYWHLVTRPDEHARMSNGGWEGRLKLAAWAIHERLGRDAMQCVIHGDAKDANMLFLNDGIDGGEKVVGMYDFQYCGRAPPSVDLAYFLCVAVGETSDDYREYTRYYHDRLIDELGKGGGVNIGPLPTLAELSESIELAFCDLQRFLCGWGHWGSDISSLVIRVLDRLDGGSKLKSEDAYRVAMMREYG